MKHCWLLFYTSYFRTLDVYFVSKSTVSVMMKKFSASGEELCASFKKELKMDFQILADIVSKALLS